MIASNTATQVDFDGDDTTVEFAIPFPVFEHESIEVYVVIDEGLDSEVKTDLVHNTDFTLSKVGIYGLSAVLTLIDADQAWLDVTQNGLKTGYKLYIEFSRHVFQPAVLRTLGNFAPVEIEKSLDRMAMGVRRGSKYLDSKLAAIDARFTTVINLIATVTGLATTTPVVADGASVAVDETDARQHLMMIQSSGAAATLAAVPFSGSPEDGKIVMVMGVSDVNTVRINHNDVAGGVVMQGDIILKRFDIIYFLWVAAQDRYVEISRSKQ